MTAHLFASFILQLSLYSIRAVYRGLSVLKLFFFTLGQHFDWHALRLVALHQTPQVVPHQVQEVGLHTQEVRIDVQAVRQEQNLKSCTTGNGRCEKRKKAREKQFRCKFDFLLFRVSSAVNS